MKQLQTFITSTLRLLPVSLWWVMGGLVGAWCSIQLEKEIFPNTPAAVQVARVLVAVCALAIPLLGVWWLWRIAASLEHAGWRLLWYLGAAGATGLVVLVLSLGILLFR